MLTVPIAGGSYVLINPTTITFMKASGDRTRIHFVSGEDIVVDRSISDLVLDLS